MKEKKKYKVIEREKKRVTLAIKVTPSYKIKIEEVAKSEKRSVTNLVEEALNRYIGKRV